MQTPGHNLRKVITDEIFFHINQFFGNYCCFAVSVGSPLTKVLKRHKRARIAPVTSEHDLTRVFDSPRVID